MPVAPLDIEVVEPVAPVSWSGVADAIPLYSFNMADAVTVAEVVIVIVTLPVVLAIVLHTESLNKENVLVTIEVYELLLLSEIPTVGGESAV